MWVYMVVRFPFVQAISVFNITKFEEGREEEEDTCANNSPSLNVDKLFHYSTAAIHSSFRNESRTRNRLKISKMNFVSVSTYWLSLSRFFAMFRDCNVHMDKPKTKTKLAAAAAGTKTTRIVRVHMEQE